MCSVPTCLVVLGVLPAVFAAGRRRQRRPCRQVICWFYSTPQPLQNFTLNGDTYVDASGKSGSVTLLAGMIHFSGGHLDGRNGLYQDGNPPTISFYNADGERVLLCQLTQKQ